MRNGTDRDPPVGPAAGGFAPENAASPRNAGVPEPHAKAIAATMRKAIGEGLATKADIRELRTEFRAEIRALKWVLGFQFALILAIAVRVFGVA